MGGSLKTLTVVAIVLTVVALGFYFAMGTTIVTYESKRSGFPHSAQACANRGGTWSRFGDARYYCRVSARDNGKSCQSAAECEGACLVDERHGDRGHRGVCSAELVLFGCDTELEQAGEFKVCRD